MSQQFPELERVRVEMPDEVRDRHLASISRALHGKRTGRTRFRLLAIAAVLVLLLPVIALAAERTGPGDLLYPIRELVERVLPSGAPTTSGEPADSEDLLPPVHRDRSSVDRPRRDQEVEGSPRPEPVRETTPTTSQQQRDDRSDDHDRRDVTEVEDETTRPSSDEPGTSQTTLRPEAPPTREQRADRP